MNEIAENHKGDVRGFTILSQAWHADKTRHKAGDDIVTMGFYSPDGSTSGEFEITWKRQGDDLVARLEAFGDSWSALAGFSDVLQHLADLDSERPTVAQVTAVLTKLGIVDQTVRVSPRNGAASESSSAVVALATMLECYIEALNKLRRLGRQLSNEPAWAKDIEFGSPLKEVKGVSPEVYWEIQQLSKTVQVLRKKLIEAVRESGDPALKSQYKELLLPI